ncbi:hypothetical protein KKG41_00240 [Patescibacteria group bacterium]|nr:hypothetical protein [Patescibacteria group bacterium]MBU1890653.1 hypothetical protein [Patescibacteria group bacterium]
MSFFLRTLVRNAHLTEETANFDGLRALLVFRTKERTYRGQDHEVTLVAIAALKQMGAQLTDVTEWISLLCNNVLKNPSAESQVTDAISQMPDDDTSSSLIDWVNGTRRLMETLATTLY